MCMLWHMRFVMSPRFMMSPRLMVSLQLMMSPLVVCRWGPYGPIIPCSPLMSGARPLMRSAKGGKGPCPGAVLVRLGSPQGVVAASTAPALG
jgi:hypothetical protein